MANEVKNVPELRFPEFRNEWEDIKFENIFQEVSNKTGDLVKNPLFSLTVENGITPKSDRYKRDFLVKKNDNFKIVEPNNIVYNPMNVTLGAIDLSNYNYNLAVSGYYHVLKIINNFNVSFVANFLKTNRMITHYKKIATGTLIEKQRVHFSEFKNIIKKFPSIKEQQKIGDFFSKIDRQIELEEKKLEKLEEQKKGYMQQIFSQKLRFKDEIGNNYPNWEIEKLGDLINEVNERTISNNQYELLSSTKNGLLSQEEYFKKQIGSKDSTGYKILRLHQLVLSPQNLWLGNINFNQLFDIGIVSPSYRIYNVNHHFDINFAKYLLKSPRYIYEYAQASEQGASVVRRNLNLDLFYSIIISLPSITEQRKIGSFLNKLDKLIEKQSDKIELLKERKKGFLQKMFL